MNYIIPIIQLEELSLIIIKLIINLTIECKIFINIRL